MKKKSLKSSVINGLSWSMFEYLTVFLLQIVQLTILSRILSPSDFGIFAIATFFSSLGNSVFALGMGPSLIQKRDSIEEYFDTAWTTNLLVSAIAATLLFILSPLIINLVFNEPNALSPTRFVLSIVLISGFNNIRIVKYTKEIQMNVMYIYHVIPRLFSIGCMIGFGFFFKSYWAMVVGIIMEYVSRAVLSYIIVPIKPRFELDLVKAKELYSFGGWLQLKNVVSWIANYIDVAIVGNLLETNILGFYNRAQSLAKLPESQISKIVNVVSFPMYTKLRDDKLKVGIAFKANFDFVLIIVFILLLAVFSYGRELVEIIMGEKWVYLTEPFKVLIFSVSIQTLIVSIYPILRAFGYPRLEFVFTTLKILVLVVLLSPLIRLYGINGASYAVLISTIVSAPFLVYLVKRRTGLSFKESFISMMICIFAFIVAILLAKSYYNNEDPIYLVILKLISVVMVFFIFLGIFYLLLRKGPFESVLKVVKK